MRLTEKRYKILLIFLSLSLFSQVSHALKIQLYDSIDVTNDPTLCKLLVNDDSKNRDISGSYANECDLKIDPFAGKNARVIAMDGDQTDMIRFENGVLDITPALMKTELLAFRYNFTLPPGGARKGQMKLTGSFYEPGTQNLPENETITFVSYVCTKGKGMCLSGDDFNLIDSLSYTVPTLKECEDQKKTKADCAAYDFTKDISVNIGNPNEYTLLGNLWWHSVSANHNLIVQRAQITIDEPPNLASFVSGLFILFAANLRKKPPPISRLRVRD